MINKKIFFQSLMKMVLLLGIMGIFLYTGELWAATKSSANPLFQKAYDTLYVTFAQTRAVVYVTAGFSLVGLAVAAIFGKMPFRWLSMIAIALFTLAMAEKIVGYAVGAGKKVPTSSFVGEVGDSQFRIYVGSDSGFDNSNQFYHTDKNSLKGL